MSSSQLDIDGKVEPRLDASIPLENISFLRKGPVPVAASRVQRHATHVLVLAYLAFNLYVAYSRGADWARLLGAVIGTALAIMVPVWISAWWDGNRTQRTRYKVALWAACVLLAIQVAGLLVLRGTVQDVVRNDALGAEELAQRALHCERRTDLVCAQDSWQKYLALRPEDSRAMATLGMIRQRRDDHAGAVREFERSMAAGNGGYDVFAFYAGSLAKLGRADEAVQWYYAALAASPRLVDVREALAKLLVSQSRGYEALALLQTFDVQLESAGRPAYFTAQRIAIEQRIAEAGPSSTPPRTGMRLSEYGGHFFAPVTLGSARPQAFLVDTGATLVVLNATTLADARAGYRVLDDAAKMRTADGRLVPARVVMLDVLQVGPYALKNVKAAVCRECTALLGASALSRFDIQTSQARELQFLTLLPRE